MTEFCGDFNPLYNSDIVQLAAQAADGSVSCVRKNRENDGDVRYWGVDASSNRFLTDFLRLAEREGSRFFGSDRLSIVLMINYISAESSPGGSGGGWHVDSVRPQCKLFCYLTDCEDEENGPLCLLVHRLRFLESVVIYMNRLFGGKTRFSEKMITRLSLFGFKRAPVLSTKGLPFFAETSRIHRGLPITDGCRAMLTAYIYNGQISDSIKSQLSS